MKCNFFKSFGVFAFSAMMFAGCSSKQVPQQVAVAVPPPPAPYDWSLPQGFSHDSIKSRVGIQMLNPIKTDGSALPPGLSGQFLEFAKSKIIQSKRFAVYVGQSNATESDVIVTPFIDFITQSHKLDGREWIHIIAQISLDVKFATREDGSVKEAITLKGVAKASVPSVFGQPARNVDQTGLVNKAFDEVYMMLMQSIDRRFPVSSPASSKVFGRTVKILAESGSNAGLEKGRDHQLYMIDKDGAPVVLGRLSAENIGLDRATFKVIEWRPDEEAVHYVNQLLAGKELNLYVSQR